MSYRADREKNSDNTVRRYRANSNKQGRRKQFDIGPANPFLFPSLPPIHFLLSPFVIVGPSFFPPLSVLPLPSIFASLRLEVGALNPARGSGVEPQGDRIWCILALKSDV